MNILTQSDVFYYYYHHVDNKIVNSIEDCISSYESTYEFKKYGEYNDNNFKLKSERISHYNDVILTCYGVYYAFYKNKILWDCNNSTLVSTYHLAVPKTDNLVTINDPVYFMEYSWGVSNYTHFLTELLPRFLHFLLLKDNIPNLKLFFKSKNTMKDMDSIIDILDIPIENVIFYDENVSIPNYLIKNFYISNTFDPSITLNTDINFFTKSHFEIYKKISKCVMDKIDKNIYYISDKIKNLKKIYLSRQKVNARKLLNENEWVDKLYELGFVKIYAEDYSLIENIYIIMNVEMIVGEHGSSLSTLFFCNRKNLKVWCFGHPYEHINLLWSSMAKEYGFHFFEKNDIGTIIDDEEFNKKYIHWTEENRLKINPWIINVNEGINFIKSKI